MLDILPCLDSDEMAAARRRELLIPREQAAALGRSAVEATKTGVYRDASGRVVEWAAAVRAAVAAKRSIPPDALLPAAAASASTRTRVQVTNETTLAAAGRLVAAGHDPLALNFANGVSPGGGFLGGARAQEEVLCRSSGLYETLRDDPMYAAHRRRSRPDSTSWTILSPAVPVFRHDDGTPLDEPWPLGFLTCAAPYAPRIGQPESARLLGERIHRVLAIARAYGARSLVLGAWGCGAFANDPAVAARDFREALETTVAGGFTEVVFAIADWSPDRRFLGPFRDAF